MTAPPSGRHYLLAWFGLLLLTAASYGASFLPFRELGLVFALVIATLKAAVVLFVFMHLNREPFTTRFIVSINVTLIVLVCLGVIADVVVRN